MKFYIKVFFSKCDQIESRENYFVVQKIKLPSSEGKSHFLIKIGKNC